MSKQGPTCRDCYFNTHGLCALTLERRLLRAVGSERCPS